MKKNRPSLVLHITEPCNESWENMPSTATGKFCQRCERELIDFSGYSDTRLTEFLQQNNGKMCGRFSAGQLNRNLLPQLLPGSSSQRLSLPALALLAMTLTTQVTYGQEPIVTQQQPAERKLLPGDQHSEPHLPDSLKTRTIDGGVSVFSSTASDLRISVKVELFQDGSVLRTRYTDINGIFSITVLPHEHPDFIRFSKSDGEELKGSWHEITASMYDGFTSFSLEPESIEPTPPIHFLGGFGSRHE
jgi:hypothetical protein